MMGTEVRERNGQAGARVKAKLTSCIGSIIYLIYIYIYIISFLSLGLTLVGKQKLSLHIDSGVVFKIFNHQSKCIDCCVGLGSC